MEKKKNYLSNQANNFVFQSVLWGKEKALENDFIHALLRKPLC